MEGEEWRVRSGAGWHGIIPAFLLYCTVIIPPVYMRRALPLRQGVVCRIAYVFLLLGADLWNAMRGDVWRV